MPFRVLMACLPSYAQVQVNDRVSITAFNDRMAKTTTPGESGSIDESKIMANATVTAPTFESSRSQALMRALGSAMAYTHDVGTIGPDDKLTSQEQYTIKVIVNTRKIEEGYETTVQVGAENKEYTMIAKQKGQ